MHLLYMSIDLNAGKVERVVQQNQYHISACEVWRPLIQFYITFTEKLLGSQAFIRGVPQVMIFFSLWAFLIYII